MCKHDLVRNCYAFNIFQIEFFTVEDYDRTVNKKLATFVRRLLRGLMELPVILKLSWSRITKRLAKQTNCKELIGIKSMKGVVMLFKGKITLRKKCSALNRELSCVITLSGASYDSFCAKNVVTSANVELKIQKTLHNIHWENKQKLLDDVREKVEAAQAAGGEDDDSDE